MRNRKWLLWTLAALLLAGCSLARPEAEAKDGDRWVGFYVAPSQGYVDHLADNPYVVEYGTLSAETDRFGTLTFPRDVLFAVEDEAGNYTFPGIEKGYSLFIYRRYDVEHPGYQGGNYSVGVASNMAPGEEAPQFKYTDEGVSEIASGVIYCGPPLGAEDWDPHLDNTTIWRYYNVFQAEDGRIYLDGSGDSVHGIMSKTQTATRTRTEDGKTRTDTLQVAVDIEAVPRLEKLLVTQFDGDNAIVRSDDLALRDELPEIACEAAAAWVLVEEVNQDGTVRTVYSVPEEGEDPVSHPVVLLDDEGLGRNAYLMIQ